MLALLAVALATAIRVALHPWLGDRYPLGPVYVAVALVGWFQGVAAATFTATVAYGVAAYVFSVMRSAWPPFDAVETAAYALICAALIALVHRVHERQRKLDAAVDDLERQSAHHRAVAAAFAFGSWSADASGRITFVAPEFLAFLGIDFDEFRRRGWSVVRASPAEIEAARARWRDCVATGAQWEWEYSVAGADGSVHRIWSRGVPSRSADGRISGWAGLNLDVTARREIESMARRLAAIIEATPDAVAIGREDGRLVYMNTAARAMLGIAADTPVDRFEHAALCPPWVIERMRADWLPTALAHGSVRGEGALRALDGRELPVSFVIMVHRDEQGAVECISTIARDVTEQRATIAALRDSEENLRLALDSAQLGLWSTDLTTGLTECSAKNLEIFGLPPDTGPVPSTLWTALIHPDDRPHVEHAWNEARAARAPYGIDYRIVRPDAVQRWVMSRARFQLDADGNPSRVRGVTMDVTERIEAARELEASNRRKDEFIATLAHELRNPLAPIRYASRLFRASTPPDMVEDAGRMVERQLAHMARLLDDLLDVSRVARGTLELELEPLDLRAVIGDALAAARPLAERDGRILEYHDDGELLPVHGDRTRLAQVFGNLLDNALKYTEPGGRISIEAGASGPDVVVEVRDDGQGIAPELLAHVFELFVRGEQSGRGAGGLGIGLSLARRLAQMHGGTLEAHSGGVGQGSRFVLRLPRRAEPAALAEPIDHGSTVVPINVASQRVLVVDDNRDAADALAQLLAMAGYKAAVEYDMRSALRTAEQLHPTIVLLDIGLPDGSGHDVARRIRASAWGGHALLVAITGWGNEADRRASADAGFDEHLTKPVEPAALLRLVAARARAVG